MRRSYGGKAFTLIELLIVAAIIGILAAIAIPNLKAAMIRAKITKVYGDFKSISNAMEMYRLDYNTYPIAKTAYSHPGWGFLTTPMSYLEPIPMDPFPLFAVNDPQGTPVGMTANASRFQRIFEKVSQSAPCKEMQMYVWHTSGSAGASPSRPVAGRDVTPNGARIIGSRCAHTRGPGTPVGKTPDGPRPGTPVGKKANASRFRRVREGISRSAPSNAIPFIHLNHESAKGARRARRLCRDGLMGSMFSSVYSFLRPLQGRKFLGS